MKHNRLEPKRHDRLQRILAHTRAELSRAPRPAVQHGDEKGAGTEFCILEEAYGREIACADDNCPFHNVPGVPGCAVRAWCPEARRDRRAADWFIKRRDEAGFKPPAA